MEIPENVLKKLEQVAERNELTIEEVKKEYEKKFNSDFIQKDSQFEDDDMRHRYACGSFWSDYMTKPKVTPTTILPIGVSTIGKSKNTGLPWCSMFFLDKTKKLRRCSFNGDVAFKTKEVSYWSIYNDVKLKVFSESNDYGADERANFENPAPQDIDKKSIIDILKIPIIKTSEAKSNEAKKDSTGHYDQLDWRAFRAFIKYENKTEYEDGEYGENGRYSIAEGDAELNISDDGVVNPSTFSISVSPTLMHYPKDSECYFLGPVRSYETKKTKETIFTMDCFCIIPIIVPPEAD